MSRWFARSSGNNIFKNSYCFAWKPAWHCMPGGNNSVPDSPGLKNHLLPESVFSPPQCPLWFFLLPAGRGGGVGVVVIFYTPVAAFCSCHLCCSICFYQGLEMHTGELNDVILGVLGRTICQAQIATSLFTTGACITPWVSVPLGFACDLTYQIT